MIQTPFNYTGNKFKLLEQIIPELDYSKGNFIDMFAGGGSIYTNVLDKYKKVLVNDIIKDLIKIHKSISESDEIIEKTNSICSTLKESKKDFLNLRESYNKKNSPEKLWALMLSCNSNLIRFNQKGEFNQTWGKRTWNKNTTKKVNEFKTHIRKYKNDIKFISKSFDEINLKESNNYMFYFDPPYAYIKDDKGNIGNKQISEAGYNNFYYKENDINLYKYCHTVNDMNSSFMISGVLEHGGETSWILDKLISDGFNYKELNFNYKKINKSGKSKKTKEIIIKNY